MSKLKRRLKKLEAQMTDDLGLVPGSPRWWTYWNEQLHKYIARDPGARNTKVPVEVLRAYVQSAEPDSIAEDDDELPPQSEGQRATIPVIA